MAFMKFSKGKPLLSVPNGLGDGSAYFSKTEGVIANIDNLPYGNSARTISAWIYISVHNTQNNEAFFSYGYAKANKRFGIGINNDGGSFEVYGADNTTTYQHSFNLKQWYHAVITFDTDYTEKCYIDGVLIGTQTHANINTQKGGATVGRSANDSGQTDWFYGNIKNVQVYNRVLSANEVTTLYNKQEITSGRVLNIPLTYGQDDESMFTSKSFVYDTAILTTSSGFDEFGYPIRYDMASECGIDYATIPTDNLILYMALKENRTTPEVVDSDVFTTNYEGNYNSANYQVVDNVPCLYLERNTNIGLITKGNRNIRQATLSYWGKFTDLICCLTSSYGNYGNGSSEIWLYFMPDTVAFSNGSPSESLIVIPKTVSNDWHNITATWDMDTNYMYLYFDGELVGELTDGSRLAPNFNVPNDRFYLNNLYRASGNGTGNSYYSSVRMYDRVLKASEIKALAKEF